MKVKKTNIHGVLVVELDAYEDHRGWFIEVFEKTQMETIGIKDDFTQDVVTISTAKNTLRGLHFQNPPYEQSKFVRCQRGAFFDVAVDLRKSSPTFGQYFSLELNDKSWTAIYLPTGIAHGLYTLEDNTHLAYKISGKYSPENAGGLVWNDPILNINWPTSTNGVLINPRDRELPLFSTKTTYFP
jgi:dTDP-4-dehydrorhamnose 3,5-epimerase